MRHTSAHLGFSRAWFHESILTKICLQWLISRPTDGVQYDQSFEGTLRNACIYKHVHYPLGLHTRACRVQTVRKIQSHNQSGLVMCILYTDATSQRNKACTCHAPHQQQSPALGRPKFLRHTACCCQRPLAGCVPTAKRGGLSSHRACLQHQGAPAVQHVQHKWFA